MASGDIFQLRVQGSFQFQESEMVFYYKNTSPTGTAVELNTLFENIVLPKLLAPMNVGAFINTLFTINGMNNADYEQRSVSSGGSWSPGSELPAHFAYGFRSPYNGPGSRYSYHRLWGVSANVFAATGGGLGASILALLSDVCDVLGLPLADATYAFTPIQITGGFRLGVNPVEAASLVGQWLCYFSATTQKSRQNYSWV